MEDLYPSRRADTASMTPIQDPVLHRPWSPQAPLTAGQAASFEHNGFLVLDRLFTEEEVALLQQEAKRLRSEPQAFDPETLITEPGSDEVRSIFAVHQQDPVLQRLAADRRLAAIAEFLLDDQVYIHQSRLNYKPGFRGKEFYWHSDFETWHVEDGMPRMRAVSISVLLTENEAINGALMLIPGSHKTYVSCVGETPQEHYRQSLKKQEYGVPDDANLKVLVDRHGIAVAAGKPGTVLVFHCNVMHGSNGNITPQPRSNVFFVYNAVSNALRAPFGPEQPRPWFLGTREPQPILARVGLLTETSRR